MRRLVRQYTLPGWKLRRIRIMPYAAVGWLLAFAACWPIAYCVQLLSRVGDQARVTRTLHDLDKLVDAVAKAYLAQRAEQNLHVHSHDALVTMSVRQLIRTGVAPASLISPTVDQPHALFSAWAAPILNTVDSTSIKIELIYIPNRVCSSFLERANSLRGIVQLTTDGGSYLKPPINSATARDACEKRTWIRFVFAAPDLRVER